MKLVFTNGVFDILHRGHVDYLTAARALGDRLVVGVNSDESTHNIKGLGRPINSFADRAAVLAALRCVDQVIGFEADTPLGLIQDLRPDVLVKGGDWPESRIVGADFVRSYGGAVVSIPVRYCKSTTAILAALRGKPG